MNPIGLNNIHDIMNQRCGKSRHTIQNVGKWDSDRDDRVIDRYEPTNCMGLVENITMIECNTCINILYHSISHFFLTLRDWNPRCEVENLLTQLNQD